MESVAENSSINKAETTTQPISGVNWKQVIIFIAFTFVLTWGVDLILHLNGGLAFPAATIVLQFQMLIPAFSAILLGVFFFKNSPLYFKTNRSTSKWFTWYFMAFTLLFAATLVYAFLRPFGAGNMSSLMLIPGVLGMILVIVLRIVGGKDSFSSVNMAGGKAKYWFLFGLAIIAYSGIQTLLAWLFKMGQPVDQSQLTTQAAALGMSLPLMMTLATIQTLLIGPFLGLLVTFGEEYGWRGYLQTELVKIGRIKGVFLVGVIWGAWHWPVIWMGYNYPGHPWLGSLLMVLFCIGLAYIIGYAVLKTKAVWLAAFLHALVNQSAAYFMGVIYTPTDTANSFGIGWPGIVVLALIVLLILRDPVWKQTE